MAKKLRKMLGNVNDQIIIDLMNLIDTQSKATLARFCANFVFDNVLPIYQKHCPHDDAPRQAILAAVKCADGQLKLSEVKEIKTNRWQRPETLDKDPVAMAAARAIMDTGVMVFGTPTHALGLVFYASAAIAYDEVGLDRDEAVYDAIAHRVAADYFAGLEAVAVADETHPVRCKWHC